MRALCVIPHYFGVTDFSGGSTDLKNSESRKRFVERTITQVWRLNSLFNIDVVICGIDGKSLVSLDLDVTNQVNSSQHVAWAALAYLGSRLEAYDYFLYVEDDILIPKFVLRRMILASQKLEANEIFLPNRVEFLFGCPVAVDLFALPGWTSYCKTLQGKSLGEAVNPHSGLLFMSRAQWELVCREVDFTKPQVTIGAYVASALARAHQGFHLLRERSIIPTHFVIHQDCWIIRNNVSRRNAFKAHLNGYEDIR